MTNEQMTSYLAKALLLLIKEKPFHEITISELVTKAGIARATYYRHFTSKEEVLHSYLKNILNNYKEKYKADISHISRYKNIHRTFEYVYNYKEDLKGLYEANLGQVFLEEINNYIISGTDLADEEQIKKYPFYSYSGSLYNVIYFWVKNDCKESIDEITNIFYDTFHQAK